MDCRWACQDEWNFMACGAPGVPFMSSRRTFGGDQFHEYYMSLRPVFPWDAGDTEFDYDPGNDPGFRIFGAHRGWYNRRDLNFSFCSDGRNPLSGYAVVFGGSDNTQTLLLRQGAVVARTQARNFLFPTEPQHGVIHWKWWKFTIRKAGPRLLVYHNNALMFDYTDPEPLSGGHVGFWSIRNGFTVSRITSMADTTDLVPDLLYVEDDAGSVWHPLLRDSLALTRQPGPAHTRVTTTVGSGFLALRFEPEAPVDLTKTPVLEIPFESSSRPALNLHLWIGGKSYVAQLTGPLDGMKSLLTPDFERGECFQLPDLRAEYVSTAKLLGQCTLGQGVARIDLREGLERLRLPPDAAVLSMVTLGNTSNDGYLLAGNGANQAGSSFAVGTPRFLPPAEVAATAPPPQPRLQ